MVFCKDCERNIGSLLLDGLTINNHPKFNNTVENINVHILTITISPLEILHDSMRLIINTNKNQILDALFGVSIPS